MLLYVAEGTLAPLHPTACHHCLRAANSALLLGVRRMIPAPLQVGRL